MKGIALLSLSVLFAATTHAWDYVAVFFAAQLVTVVLFWLTDRPDGFTEWCERYGRDPYDSLSWIEWREGVM